MNWSRGWIFQENQNCDSQGWAGIYICVVARHTDGDNIYTVIVFFIFCCFFFYLNDILNKNIYEKLNVEVSF